MYVLKQKKKKVPYIWSPLSKFAPEGHLDSVLVPCPLVKGLAHLERGTVQVQADCALCVADVFHTVQAYGIWNAHADGKIIQKKEKNNIHLVYATGML